MKTEKKPRFSVGDVLENEDEIIKISKVHKTQYVIKEYFDGEFRGSKRYVHKTIDDRFDEVDQSKLESINNLAAFIKKLNKHIPINPYIGDRGPKEPYIAERWIISTSSDWEKPECEPDFVSLEEVMMQFWPDITFLQFKKILRELEERGTYKEHDYYCHTKYDYKLIKLEKLLKHLIKNGKYENNS